jgi:membrane protease YdiL (CAAX protease family)
LIFKKAVTLLAAFAAIAAAAAVCVVALAFALYAVVRDYIGPAGGAAAVAGAAALLALILAYVATRKAKPKPLKAEDQSMTTRLIELARERPLVAAGAAVAAAVVLARNPKILTTVLSAAIAGRAARPTDTKR